MLPYQGASRCSFRQRANLSSTWYLVATSWIVARDAEIIRAFCTACADEIGTTQVLCYQRSIGVGESLGTSTLSPMLGNESDA